MFSTEFIKYDDKSSIIFEEDINNSNSYYNSLYKENCEKMENEDSEVDCYLVNNFISSVYDKRLTSLKTEEDKDNYYVCYCLNEKKNINNDNNNNINELPILYTFNIIKNEIFRKNNLFDGIKDQLQTIEKYMTEISKSFIEKKRRKKKKGKIKYIKDDDEEKKLGRKKINDLTKGIHNKLSGDNIIKKIKINFLNYSQLFLNEVLNTYLDKRKIIYNDIFKEKKSKKEDIIKSLNDKIINKMTKKAELSLLDKSLKEIFSNDISAKYKTLPANFNKQIIEKIMIEEKDNVNIMFVFNLTFREWIDIFTYKKDIQSITNFDAEKMQNLTQLFVHVEILLLKIYNGYNIKYLAYFIIYIYNYERWFLIKKDRKKENIKNSFENEYLLTI